MKLFTIFLILISSTLTLSGQAIQIGEKDSIFSESLNETRHFKTILPPSYEKYTKIKYPVIYILDGDFLIQSTSGIIEYMSKTGEIPEFIQIYISNSNRTKDFTPSHTTTNYEQENDPTLEDSGGGKEFLRFLNLELIPHINQRYRTNSFNTLIGRSLAGLIGGYDYLQNETELSSYILIDPSFWWDKQLVVRLADEVSQKSIENRRIYITSSDNFEFSNYIEEMRNSQNSFYEKVHNHKIDSSKIRHDYFEKNTHGTVTIPSIYNGLTFIFADYELKGMKYRTADEIINHFAKFSKAYKAEFTPLEGMINWLASIQNDKDKLGALKLYELNAKNYPKSVVSLLNLAEQHELLNMPEKALEDYKNILKIDSENQTVIDKIKTLQGK
ncbi:alpha/beta hydrolase-fold protein [Zobellia nedashkovskayae]|uniref:alpha/beta hydrolase-fold protein n=1 Tax=Zobellia nedashkovskayae TaxID=2779510 RepID=UPI00188C6125|nr:alpha/beta hydrolase-fold protein [Zobellia nedashkovskayae]